MRRRASKNDLQMDVQTDDDDDGSELHLWVLVEGLEGKICN
jgi:hypothetical protein